MSHKFVNGNPWSQRQAHQCRNDLNVALTSIPTKYLVSFGFYVPSRLLWQHIKVQIIKLIDILFSFVELSGLLIQQLMLDTFCDLLSRIVFCVTPLNQWIYSVKEIRSTELFAISIFFFLSNSNNVGSCVRWAHSGVLKEF